MSKVHFEETSEDEDDEEDGEEAEENGAEQDDDEEEEPGSLFMRALLKYILAPGFELPTLT